MDDFEIMGWHDNKIHAIASDKDKFELRLDIDYICKWVQIEDSFSFWVAPATLIFKNVYDLNISSGSLDLTISNIERNKPVKPKNADYIEDIFEYDWIIEIHDGEITFKSVGFTQIIRANPILIDRQNLSIIERGGIQLSNEIAN